MNQFQASVNLPEKIGFMSRIDAVRFFVVLAGIFISGSVGIGLYLAGIPANGGIVMGASIVMSISFYIASLICRFKKDPFQQHLTLLIISFCLLVASIVAMSIIYTLNPLIWLALVFIVGAQSAVWIAAYLINYAK